MDELTFLKRLAAEVKEHDEPRLKQLVEWCTNIAVVAGQCGGSAETQELHGAVTAGCLFSDIRNIEITGEMPPEATGDSTAFTYSDTNYVLYNFRRDAEKRTITVVPSVMEAIPGQVLPIQKGKHSETLQFASLVLQLAPDAEIPESIIALS